MATYEVIVGNVGRVWEGTNVRDARFCARQYVDYSKRNTGRAAGESVVLMKDGEILEEYRGTVTSD